ncbi:MAG: hypothetical protein D6689_01890 [Deltaproteobacteria bacterium]|nr:MAG: hypothetical protein D6689_01890 [Deltaproteobacteria bacterium]
MSAIPAACLAHLTSGEFVFHYAHRSHGSQIIVGAESIEQAAPQYAFAASYTSIPSEEGVFKMWDGMRDGNLVTPEQYWASDAGLAEVRAILSANPSIRYSMWAWSFEISEQSEADVQRYLDAIDALEAEFPNVTFIYMTGPAQGEYMAVNRFQRNEQIRAFAADRGKVLYDFGDLDAWSGGDRHTIDVGGTEVPIEHPDWSIDTPGHSEYEYTHTTRASCENKARAFWVMMAVLEGCAD